jgi:hypothetical protein
MFEAVRPGVIYCVSVCVGVGTKASLYYVRTRDEVEHYYKT